MSTQTVIHPNLFNLFRKFSQKSFNATKIEEGSTEQEVMNKCEILFKRDYVISKIDNSNGALCAQYPNQILIPVCEEDYDSPTTRKSIPANSSPENSPTSTFFDLETTPPKGDSATSANTENKRASTIYEQEYDVHDIEEHIGTAKYARCRQRFAVPVIMYRGKYVCRSATVSIFTETFARQAVSIASTCFSNIGLNVDNENNESASTSLLSSTQPSESHSSYDDVIKSDVSLLKALHVNTVIDLMVEKCKYKYCMKVSSSEKADDTDDYYKDFNILSAPYPGCEFFTVFNKKLYEMKNLHYDWSQSINDTENSLSSFGPTNEMNIKWDEYRQWDVLLLTQNYLKACLKCLQEENCGLLIHCISGWDRTPLFISLVRLSLWGDGLIHKSLTALEMAYFTIGYDWFLFGHQLKERVKKEEDILYFFIEMLKHITHRDFVMPEPPTRKRTKTSSSSGSSIIVLGDEPFADDTSSTSLDQDSHNKNTSPSSKTSDTDPISVPGASGSRKRKDSLSPIGSGWQFITQVGSFKNTSNANIDENPPIRAERLEEVRIILKTTYWKYVKNAVPTTTT